MEEYHIRQFINQRLNKFYEKLNIKHIASSVEHPDDFLRQVHRVVRSNNCP